MSTERIEWKADRHSEVGRVAGLRFFSVHYALSGGGYSLTTTLPVKSAVLEEKHSTATHAKVAAERLWAAFIQRVTAEPTTARDRTTPAPAKEKSA